MLDLFQLWNQAALIAAGGKPCSRVGLCESAFLASGLVRGHDNYANELPCTHSVISIIVCIMGKGSGSGGRAALCSGNVMACWMN
jgi:hypothetical protein